MTAAVSTLLEIGELVRTRPGLDAPPNVVAAWYEQKALVLRHVAAETGDANTQRCSRRAHEHAVALLAHNALIGGMPGQGNTAALRAALLAGEVTRR
jgi:hypothetical protein